MVYNFKIDKFNPFTSTDCFSAIQNNELKSPLQFMSVGRVNNNYTNDSPLPELCVPAELCGGRGSVGGRGRGGKSIASFSLILAIFFGFLRTSVDLMNNESPPKAAKKPDNTYIPNENEK